MMKTTPEEMREKAIQLAKQATAAWEAMRAAGDAMSNDPTTDEESALSALVLAAAAARVSADEATAAWRSVATLSPAAAEQAAASAAQLAAIQRLDAKDDRTPGIAKTQSELDREYDEQLEREQE